MSDLRTRIAKVLAAHRDNYGNDCQCGWVDNTDLYKEFTGHEQHVADAVIRELDLEREESFMRPGHEGTTLHRYVTDWKADDE